MSNVRPTLTVLAALMVSCSAPPPPIPQAPQSLPDFPIEDYRPVTGEDVYQIDSARSRTDILVHRGGKLSRFGHDHVVSTTQLEGYILVAADDFRHSHADIRLALDSLIVDDPVLRDQYSLDTRPSAQDIEKTSENMRERVLQTKFWPKAHLKVEITGGTPAAPDALLTVTLHGARHSFPVTFQLTGMGTTQLLATGAFSLRQSDYGIEPFSVLGGGLQVLDSLDIRFRLLASQLGE
jgi:hypothetical protein